ncbi:hypothetical protein AYO20_08860 [Fonsecaea nubica]|uniref:Uncharacterized protein n=1 Tax=Fonsecaea nubica TaxID=856822 RepID=A0A178CLB6_9EURO|nr:hypothetical protein AYO20_08860 [Fonsecaea nubica]OAL30144.1 hypothetical protein AYO20_08860 [Fonsecaea nubica]
MSILGNPSRLNNNDKYYSTTMGLDIWFNIMVPLATILKALSLLSLSCCSFRTTALRVLYEYVPSKVHTLSTVSLYFTQRPEHRDRYEDILNMNIFMMLEQMAHVIRVGGVGMSTTD